MGTTGMTNVTIHWKNHCEVLAKGIQDFYKSQFLVDTDVSITGDFLKAHRLILAIFLPTFKNSMDRVGPLNGLNLEYVTDQIEDIRALVEFVYTGTVTVSKDRLEHLGSLAECLQFEGLSRVIRQLHEPEVEESDFVSTHQANEPGDDHLPLDVGLVINDGIVGIDLDVDKQPEVKQEFTSVDCSSDQPISTGNVGLDSADQPESGPLTLRISNVQGAKSMAELRNERKSKGPGPKKVTSEMTSSSVACTSPVARVNRRSMKTFRFSSRKIKRAPETRVSVLTPEERRARLAEWKIFKDVVLNGSMETTDEKHHGRTREPPRARLKQSEQNRHRRTGTSSEPTAPISRLKSNEGKRVK